MSFIIDWRQVRRLNGIYSMFYIVYNRYFKPFVKLIAEAGASSADMKLNRLSLRGSNIVIRAIEHTHIHRFSFYYKFAYIKWKTDTILHVLFIYIIYYVYLLYCVYYLCRKEMLDIHNINYHVIFNKMRLSKHQRLFVIVRCGLSYRSSVISPAKIVIRWIVDASSGALLVIVYYKIALILFNAHNRKGSI
jgi:hypothetical protein